MVTRKIAAGSFPALFLSFLFFSSFAEAKLVQILHTNDLHSHLEYSNSHDPVGGYARVKGTFDKLKQDAAARGIETITMDGGDFSEGSEFYLAGQGVPIWRMMNLMGYDAVVMGNHDWLCGPEQLDWQISSAQPNFALLGANIKLETHLPNLPKAIRPYVELKRNGIRIAIIGLTTDEFVFNWRVKDGSVKAPELAALEYVPELQKRNDFVIVLSHLGTSRDQSLVHRVNGIDLVVGAHSHELLAQPVYEYSPRGWSVPILQAGDHGNFVGQLIVDMVPGKPLKVVNYRLVPINAESPQAPEVVKAVRQVRTQLEQEYSSEWFKEVVGYSKVILQRQAGEQTIWSKLVADTLKEKGDADLSLDIPAFSGLTQPAGAITREQIFILYPRVFSTIPRYGWTIWTANARGWLLKLALTAALEHNLAYGHSGISYELDQDKNGRVKVRNLKIGGEPINPFRNYRLAVPEGIGRASVEINDFFKLILEDAEDTGKPIWFAIEEKIRSLGVIEGSSESWNR